MEQNIKYAANIKDKKLIYFLLQPNELFGQSNTFFKMPESQKILPDD